MSQGIRKAGVRQSRYIGLAKTHLQHILIAAALNLCREFIEKFGSQFVSSLEPEPNPTKEMVTLKKL